MLDVTTVSHSARAVDQGLLIASVVPGSALADSGVRPGDRILAVDGLVPRDLIDLQFDLPAARVLFLETAAGERVGIQIQGEASASSLLLADPVPGGIRECNNHCEFCFIRGLPGGLRPTLYVFDDDYRYSFLWGNFLTLTNLEEADWQRIGFQRLSPLNVSVHATDPMVRARMLNHRQAPAIVPMLQRLASMGIDVHAQVVLCAGINDGEVLERTLGDLAELFPSVQSVSVVPVGLTRYSRVHNIRRTSAAESLASLEQCERWQLALLPRLGVRFVYPSDELYTLAGRPEFPAAAAYDGFPVLSNGVGVTRFMLDEWERLLGRRRRHPRSRGVALITGRLAAPALVRMSERWERYAGWQLLVQVAESRFFGSDIGASGLLAGADLLTALKSLPAGLDDIILPRAAFGFDGLRTLDGVDAETIGNAYPARVHLASTPAEMLDILFHP